MTTELEQVFRMNEGTGDTSYAKASYIQKQVLSLTKFINEKALMELFKGKEKPTTICIVDLGCSSAAQNTLDLISEFIDTIEKASGKLENKNGCQEYQVYLNDLPGNDFNTIFRSLGNFELMLKHKIINDDSRHCFVNGVPGSFYGRLFPSNNVHFVHSSYSLHWLSQVPQGIEDNKGNIGIGRTSPLNVLKAYYDQHEKDFSLFLRSRSKEIVPGGMMVLTMLGRHNSSELYSKEVYHWLDFLAIALNDMVSEGLIEEEKLNNFNFPLYCPSGAELGFLVEKEGSFALKEVQVSEVNWELTIQNENSCKSYDHNDLVKCVRAVQEPFVVNHFGEAIIEEVFDRYSEITKASMAKEKKNVFINITIWLTRKDQSTCHGGSLI